MKDFFFDLARRSIGMPLRNRGLIHQTGITVFQIGLTPSVETATTDAKVSTCLGDVTDLISVLKNAKLSYGTLRPNRNCSEKYLLHSLQGDFECSDVFI
jgi:hypothetical protein